MSYIEIKIAPPDFGADPRYQEPPEPREAPKAPKEYTPKIVRVSHIKTRFKMWGQK